MNQKFPASERIRSKKLIEALFNRGQDAFAWPFKVKFMTDAAGSRGGADVLITVPKKIARRAVDRNRIKRLTREAWRKNKSRLIESCRTRELQLHVALIFIGKTGITYTEVEKGILRLMSRLLEEVEKNKNKARR